MTLVLGVDGGGSKTTARLAEVGPGGRLCVLGSGFASGSNPLSVGWSAAEEAIAEAIQEAFATTPARPSVAVLAIAGCGSPSARDRLDSWASQQRFADRVLVTPDTEPLLAGVPAGTPAVGIIAGTGSSALARRADGTTFTVGGWGYLIDDAGSGFALGRDALRHLAARSDRGEPADLLSAAILGSSQLAEAAELKAPLYEAANPRRWVAQLAPTVLETAFSGDHSAMRIAASNAERLAHLAAYAATRLALLRPPQVVLAGGLLQGSAPYRRLLVEQLLHRGWRRQEILVAEDSACLCAKLAAVNC